MSLLGAIGSGLSLLGIAKQHKQQRGLSKKVLKKLNEKQQPLEIPLAYRQLLTQLGDQAAQLGNSQRTKITQSFNDNLAKMLGQLQQRGLGSSNLRANLAQGNERRKQESLMGLEDMLLGQRLGIQQNVGLQGLGTSASERNQLANLQGGMLGNLAKPLLLAQPYSNMAGALQGIAGMAGGLG